jgi:hypothetical protein
MPPSDCGFCLMKFTRAAQMAIDNPGNTILRPLDDFIVKYDAPWKEKLRDAEFRKRLVAEVEPCLLNLWTPGEGIATRTFKSRPFQTLILRVFQIRFAKSKK